MSTVSQKLFTKCAIIYTYVRFKLVLQPGEVKVEVGLLHEHRVPASELGDDTGSHVLHKLIIPVE